MDSANIVYKLSTALTGAPVSPRSARQDLRLGTTERTAMVVYLSSSCCLTLQASGA